MWEAGRDRDGQESRDMDNNGHGQHGQRPLNYPRPQLTQTAPQLTTVKTKIKRIEGRQHKKFQKIKRSEGEGETKSEGETKGKGIHVDKHL